MKNYTIKFIKLYPPSEEMEDMFRPTYEFFADKVEMGNKVEMITEEFGKTHIHIITREEANKIYSKLISLGYEIVEEKVA